MNIRLAIEYDGTPFAGWQRQPEAPTIQAAIEDVIARVTGSRVPIYGAGRTDAGVHAAGQVAHFHTEAKVPAEKWAELLNFYLPPEIRVLESREVPDTFHARKSAVGKLYVYRVLNRRVASALDRRVYFYPGRLDWDKIRGVLPHFVGEKDFRGFQGAGASVKTTVRRVERFELVDEGGGFYRFEIEGNGFLKQMVRAIVGTVLEVGKADARGLEAIEAVFRTGDRRLAGPTAPPGGLILARVHYPEAADASV